jgi:hypothetical protein
MRFLNRFASAEEGTVRFTALDFSGDNVIVRGHVLYLRDIRYFVETIIQEVKVLLKEKLFFGLDIFDLNWSPGMVHEQPRDRSIGYSCFQDPVNTFHSHRFDLLRAMLTHPSLRGRFHFVNKDRKIIWMAGPCFSYMSASHDAEMLLFCGTQLSVGEPARGSEIASNLVGNVSGGTIRNVFVLFQYFCMMGTFNKTSHQTERDLNMMRVPHPEIGRLWMLYLTFVRPVITIWQSYFNGQAAARRAKDRLFFGPYRPVTSSELSRSLSLHTHRLLNIIIGISLWRHIVTWFLNYHSVRFQTYHTLLDRSVLASQSCHGEGTHAQYAADSRLPAGTDFHTLFETMRVSGIWHELIGFSTVSQLALLEAMARVPSHIGKASHIFMPRTEGYSTLSMADVAEEVKRQILPDILQAISQSRANDIAQLLDNMGIVPEGSPSRALTTHPVTHITRPSRLYDLSTFLNHNSASFNDHQVSDPGLHRIPVELAPMSHLQTDLSTSHLFPSPINQPAPSASFSHHLAAANACLAFGKATPTSDEELGRYIHVACNVLAKSCVNCWCHGFEYYSHTLAECDLYSFGKNDEEWQQWVKLLRFPVGCCFYCGCPQKVCLYHAYWMDGSLP